MSGTNGHIDLEALTGRKWKIAPVPVPSDDCVVHVGRRYGELVDASGAPVLDESGAPKRGVIVEGEELRPHVGETVWILPVQNMAVYVAFTEFMRVYSEPRGEDVEFVNKQNAAWFGLAEKLAGHIAAWDWTDLAGDPLPQPYKNPDALLMLDNEEFTWLRDVVQAGPPVERKNGHAPSPSTSSATGPRRSKPSSAGSAPASTAHSPAPS